MQAVDHFIAKHQLVKKGTTVVVAVSGGPDSMALLDYFRRKRDSWQLRIIAAHVNHQLRGQAASEDYHYVASFCHKNDILFAGTELDVQAYKDTYRLSTQTAARECRYRFFAQIMKKHRADYLALAHHGDDQVETMLMRQVRGAFGAGLSGIPVKREFAGGQLIRPFLCLCKQDIEDYLKKVGIHPRRDPTNDHDDYTRNRFRHTVLPFLKKENPKLHLRFQQQSEALRADDAFLRELAAEWLERVVEKKDSGKMTLNIALFQTVPIALQRRVIHLILNWLYLSVPESLSSRHIEQIVHLCDAKKSSGQLDLPRGLSVIRSYERVVFTFQKEKIEPFCYTLAVPSELVLPNGVIRADMAATKPKTETESHHFFADADAVYFPLKVRSRKPGDRMAIKGMSGSKKIKDIFIDEKIPRSQRPLIPIIADAKGRILWLAGLKRSPFAAISDETIHLLHLSYHKSGGPLAT